MRISAVPEVAVTAGMRISAVTGAAVECGHGVGTLWL
jgi:hypothetical protein